MRELILKRSDPKVRQAKFLNAYLSRHGFDHAKPISADEYMDDEGEIWISYSQHEDSLTHEEIAEQELARLARAAADAPFAEAPAQVADRGLLGRLKWALTGK
ncbi:MAG: hypothetical protein ACT4O5_15730 [Gammaproteobacteria bacterium]